jgi:uncharacterized protein involved in exopolysaccharide biosynthesis
MPSPRWRLVAFLAAFLPAATASLIYTYTRPPEYCSAALLRITPPAAVESAADAKAAPAVTAEPAFFEDAARELTSRPLVDSALARLSGRGALPDLGPDPAGAAQRMLVVQQTAGAAIVHLSATGVGYFSFRYNPAILLSGFSSKR